MAGITYQIFNYSKHEVFCRHGGEVPQEEKNRLSTQIAQGNNQAVPAGGKELLHIWAAEDVDGPPQDCRIDFHTLEEGKSHKTNDFVVDLFFDLNEKKIFLSGEPLAKDDINVQVRVKDLSPEIAVNSSNDSKVVFKTEKGVSIDIRKATSDSLMMKTSGAKFVLQPHSSNKIEIFVVENDRS